MRLVDTNWVSYQYKGIMDDELDRLFKEGRIHPLTYKYIKDGIEKGIVNPDKLIKIKFKPRYNKRVPKIEPLYYLAPPWDDLKNNLAWFRA